MFADVTASNLSVTQTMRSYWDEDLAILSAENVSFSLETAGLGSRLAALAIDTAIQLFVAFLVFIAFLGVIGYFNLWRFLAPLLGSPTDPLGKITVFISALMLLFAIGYFALFEYLWDGQTPGKRWFGLRVTTTNGLPLSLWPAVIRNVVRVVDFLPFGYGFGAAICLANDLNQRGGDLAAGTIVVVEGKREKARNKITMREAVDGFLQSATTVPGTEESTPFQEAELSVEAARPIDPEAVALAQTLNREDYELARDFLARRETLPKVARARLASSLAARLATKMQTAAPADAETFIAETVATLARAYAG